MTEQQQQHSSTENKPIRTYSILLIGFEPFGTPRPLTNPSWELLRPLNNLEIELNDTYRVHLHCRELPVAYTDIHRIMPTLHPILSSSSIDVKEEVDAVSAEQRINYDVYIHIGQGYPGRVSLERQAHHGPYTILDNNGKAPHHPYCKGQDSNPNYPLHHYHEVYRTRVDVPALKTWLTTQCSWLHIEVSEDPGLYLCEYVYYHSLHFSHAMANPQHENDTCTDNDDDHQGKPILFIHVPIPPSPYTIEQLTALVRDAIQWLVQHYLIPL